MYRWVSQPATKSLFINTLINTEILYITTHNKILVEQWACMILTLIFTNICISAFALCVYACASLLYAYKNYLPIQANSNGAMFFSILPSLYYTCASCRILQSVTVYLGTRQNNFLVGFNLSYKDIDSHKHLQWETYSTLIHSTILRYISVKISTWNVFKLNKLNFTSVFKC